MNSDEVQNLIGKIDQMSQVEMATIQRFEPCGSPYFSHPEVWNAFQVRFQSLGGMTSEMSRLIGFQK